MNNIEKAVDSCVNYSFHPIVMTRVNLITFIERNPRLDSKAVQVFRACESSLKVTKLINKKMHVFNIVFHMIINFNRIDYNFLALRRTFAFLLNYF